MKRLVAVLSVVIASSAVHAENWPQFRGPYFNGSTSESDLPSQWSRTKNVAWVAELPGPSAATPAVWKDHVFVSSTDPEADSLEAICVDRKTGQQKWRHRVAQGIRKDARSDFSSPSPATDGKTVVFFYGSGELVAFDFDGHEKWKRNIQDDYGQFAFQWTFSTSPLIYDGKLYMQVLQRDTAARGRGFTDRENKSYLLALEPETGETIWRHFRPCQAREESREAFTTPMPFDHNGRKELLVAGGDDLSGHDPGTGKELWRWGTWNPDRITHWRLVPSPIAGDGIILACAPKRDPIYAVKAGGSGDLSDDSLAWVSPRRTVITSDVPTPAFYDGDFFVLSDLKKSISRVEPKTGDVKWTVRTPGLAKYESSPLVADDKIYFINFEGDVVVVNAKDGSEIHNVSMDEPSSNLIRSSIIASQGQLFIRTHTKLYCIGA